MSWLFRLAAVFLLILGIVASPLRALAATARVPIASVGMVEPSATTQLERTALARREPRTAPEHIYDDATDWCDASTDLGVTQARDPPSRTTTTTPSRGSVEVRGAIYEPGATVRAAEEVGGTSEATSAFHHTTEAAVESIARNGLRPGTYATPTAGLSPIQAHIELALNPAGGARNAIVQIDLAGLRAAGYEIPSVTRVGSQFRMPGGGFEMQFPYTIPPEFITVVTP